MDMLNEFNFDGRADGLGNRIEEIIRLEAICNKQNATCNYFWSNQRDDRSYEILLRSRKVIISDQREGEPSIELSPFADEFTQEEILLSARSIESEFEIGFENGLNPLGVHIRGSDRIGGDHPHFMKDENEFKKYLGKTIDLINRIKPESVFICADRAAYKAAILRQLSKGIGVVEPICDARVPGEYRDLFALSLCEKIFMSSKFSSFAITASLIGNIPLVAYVRNEQVANRYQHLTEYELDFDNLKHANLKISETPKLAGRILNRVLSGLKN